MRETSYEEKIEFLKGYRQAKHDEINYLAESEALLDCKIISAPLLTGMPKAHNQSDLSKLQVLIEEKQDEYTRKRYMATMKAVEIMECINKLENVTERDVLLQRYIKLDNSYNYYSWGYIAKKLGYSRSRLWDYHDSAIKNLIIN